MFGNPMKAIVDAQERLARHARRMAPGSLGGRTDVASPVSPTAKGLAVPVTKPVEADDGQAVVPYLWVVRHSHQSIVGTMANIDIIFTELYNSGGSAASWSAGAPEIVTINEDGIYVVTGYIPWGIGGAAPVGIIRAQLWDSLGNFDVNDSTTVSGAPHIGEHFTGVSHVGYLEAGTELHLAAAQSTGLTQTASIGGATGTGYGASLKVAKLGPAGSS